MSIIDQKKYLEKYMSKDEIKKKSKKKKKSKQPNLKNRIKIIDDNIDVHESVQVIEDIQNETEDAPQIVAVYDERPVELMMDKFKRDGSNWTSFELKPQIKTEPLDDDSLNAEEPDAHPSSSKSNLKHSDEDPYNINHSIAVKRKDQNTEDSSPPRKRHNNSDSDVSPPRRRRQNSKDGQRHKDNSNDDHSPPRRRTYDYDKSDKSIKRKSRWEQSKSKCESQHYANPSRDLNAKHSSKRTDPQKTVRDTHSREIIEAQSTEIRTLSGKRAGLQSAKQAAEADSKSIIDEELTANTKTIIRDRATGRIRNLENESKTKTEKDANLTKQYDRWGKGIKQVDDYNEKLKQDSYEMSKPLARYADDQDLESYLKSQEREGDPMLDYIRKKRKTANIKAGVSIKPMYQGEFMPNRYGIRPGHKWDGVDRSNGYERKWFEAINKKNAQREEAYRWNSEDM